MNVGPRPRWMAVLGIVAAVVLVAVGPLGMAVAPRAAGIMSLAPTPGPGPHEGDAVEATPAARTLAGAFPAGGPMAPRPSASLEVGTIALNGTPQAVAVDSWNGAVYVADYSTSNLTVINASTDRVVGAIAVKAPPYAMAFDPANGRLFEASDQSSSLNVIDTQTNRIVDSVAVGSAPTGVAYDPHNGYIYVANSGSNTVSAIDGSSDQVKATVSLGAGFGPFGVAAAGDTGSVYVTGHGAGEVVQINDSLQKSADTFSVGASPEGVAYDPASGLVYVANTGSGTLSVLGGPSIATLSVGDEPNSIAYDAADGNLYVADQGDNLTIVNGANASVVGWVDDASSPIGVAYGNRTSDVYVVDFAGEDVRVLAPPLEVSVQSTPTATDAGFAVHLRATATFGLPVTSYAWTFGDGKGATTSANTTSHSYAGAGQFTVGLTVTDAGNYTATGGASVTIHSAPVVSKPNASAIGGDVGQNVTFRTTASQGTTPYAGYVWSGLPALCSGVKSATVVCSLSSAVNLTIGVKVTDSVGATSAASPALAFEVDSPPIIATPSADHSSADAGEAIHLSVNASGGSGTFASYAWSIVPAGTCTQLTGPSPTCTFGSPGTVTVSASATDTFGDSTGSSLALLVHVGPALAVGTVLANRTAADVGQTLSFSAAAAGGAGSFTYDWSSTSSAGCATSDSAVLHCRVAAPGPITAALTVTDADGGTVTSTSSQLMGYSDPTVSTPTLSSPSVALGASFTLSATANGGYGAYTYRWTGLPENCTANTADATCVPTDAGDFSITVTVTDANGLSATSAAAFLNVTSAGSSGSGGLSTLELAGIGGGVVVVAAIVAVALLMRRKGRGGPSRASEGASDGEPETTAKPPS
jgi:YVTN family beta-propeller protein